jgi:hypothetical protein
MEMSENQQ